MSEKAKILRADPDSGISWVEITELDIANILLSDLYRLMTRYGRQSRDGLDSISLPPSAMKLFEIYSQSKQRIFYDARGDDYFFEGIKIVCHGAPFIMFNFKPSHWHIAQQEAVKFTSDTGGIDA